MVLAYDLLVTAFTALFLSFLVAKLVSFALSGGEVGDRRGISAAVDNGDNQNKGLEKRLRVAGSKSKKKKVKKISAETVLVSEFEGKIEPPLDAKDFGGLIKADDSVDDCEKLGSVGKGFEFPVKNEGLISSYVREEVCCPTEGLDQETNHGNDSVDDCEKLGYAGKGFEFPVKNEGLISSYAKEIDFRGEEGLDQETNQGNDLGKLIVHREDDSVNRVVGLVTGRIDPKEGDTMEDQDEHQLESEEKVGVQNEDIGFCNGNEEIGFCNGNEEGEMEISDGEEWEGIERNELVSDFAKAVRFVECVEKQGGLNKLGSDVILQFYGLQKAAMEGPCHDPPSSSAKLSARAMWNAWQKFGSMDPEEAMEKYITLVSDKFPGWIDGHPSLDGKMNSEEDEACSSSEAKLNTPRTLTHTNESKPGAEPVMSSSDLAGSSSPVNKDEECDLSS